MPKGKNKRNKSRLAPTIKPNKEITNPSSHQTSTTTPTHITTTQTKQSKVKEEGEETEEINKEEMNHRKNSNKRKREIRENDLTWLPEEGTVIYVVWKTFPESEGKNWEAEDTSNMYIEGIYLSREENGKGWNVYFHSLDKYLERAEYLLDWEWIHTYGSDTYRGDGTKVILTKETIRRKRKELETVEEEEEGDETVEYQEMEIIKHQLITKFELSEVCTLLGTDLLERPENSKGIATWNIAGLSIDQDLTAIAWLLKHRGIGLTVLQDTRLRTTDKKHCGHIWQKTIGDNALVTFSKCNDDAGIIGGQAFLMDPFWASKRQSTWSDPSELGIVMEQTFGGLRGKIRVISVYWPPPEKRRDDSKVSMQLASQLKRRLEELNRPEECIEEYVNNMIQSRLKKPAQEKILLGDFNRHWSEEFKEEMSLNGLRNLHCDTNHCTRYSGDHPTGTIDYIFSTATETGGGCEEKISWSTHSDHRPLWAWLKIEFKNAEIQMQPKKVEY